MTKVAVYGSLRKGMGNNRLLGDSKYLGTTVTKQSCSMYSLGGFPMVSLTRAVCPIVVEVYECDDGTLERLDFLEGYRGPNAQNFYDRSEVETDLGTALIYHIENSTREAPLVADGDWVNYKAKRGM